ncbi:TIGR04255 family protein [Brevibacterium limosum]|uniref:TIGR04255 family protein n=1 Tax=Brevibacterium limosum TaxID=2697565 RepID=UPI00141F5166|nr:TIGR04255 family protein [Brevibacterium limosum]
MSSNSLPQKIRRAELKNPPLARVLAQVRWPDLTSFDLQRVTSRISENLGVAYPFIREESEVEVVVTQSGVAEQKSRGRIARFFSGDEKWSISVGRNFMALESTDYTNHDDFVDRLLDGLSAVHDGVTIPRFSRIGYRYTNRIVGKADLDLLEAHFVPAVLGGHTASPANADLVHSMTESVYRVELAYLLVRSARLGAGQSIEPTLPPVDEPSWILDLDAYEEGHLVVNRDEVRKKLIHLSGIASNHFSDVVTSQFYERYDS